MIEAELREGMNFLEFHGPGKGLLRIRRVAVGTVPIRRPPTTSDQGESVTLFLRPGHGRIEWRGSGELSARIRESMSGHFQEDLRSLQTRFLSRVHPA